MGSFANTDTYNFQDKPTKDTETLDRSQYSEIPDSEYSTITSLSRTVYI